MMVASDHGFLRQAAIGALRDFRAAYARAKS
jgi:hypothetical protein